MDEPFHFAPLNGCNPYERHSRCLNFDSEIGSEEPLPSRRKKMKKEEKIYEKCLNVFEFV